MDLSSQRQYIQRAVNAAQHFDNTNRNTVYTAPTGDDFNFAIVESFLASNNHTADSKLTVEVLDGATYFSIFHDTEIKKDLNYELLSRSMILTAGQSIVCTAEHADRVHVFLSIVEYAKGD